MTIRMGHRPVRVGLLLLRPGPQIYQSDDPPYDRLLYVRAVATDESTVTLCDPTTGSKYIVRTERVRGFMFAGELDYRALHHFNRLFPDPS